MEEGEADPFGQNEELLDAAARSGFELAMDVAALAHSRSLCVMLPSPEPPMVEEFLRPWRSIVSSLDDEDHPLPDRLSPPIIAWRAGNGVAAQELLQRVLVTLAALGPDVPPGLYDQLVEGLEQLGYVAVSHHFQATVLESPDKTSHFFWALGELAARLHSENIIHGDIHSKNFSYDKKTDTVIAVDQDSICQLDRPLTIQERAGDAGLFKLSCSFPEWELFKLGYRKQAPEVAPLVFQIL